MNVFMKLTPKVLMQALWYLSPLILSLAFYAVALLATAMFHERAVIVVNVAVWTALFARCAYLLRVQPKERDDANKT
jgi:hypothetical protein